MSEYSKLTKKQLLDIITELQEEKSQFQEKQENDSLLLKKQVNDLKEEIKDIKQKQYEKDMNRFCY